MFNLRMRAPEGQSILYPVDKLVGYGEEIFKPYDGLRLGELIKSIKGYGILTPLIVRDTGEDYEVLSGHNRLLDSGHGNVS